MLNRLVSLVSLSLVVVACSNATSSETLDSANGRGEYKIATCKAGNYNFTIVLDTQRVGSEWKAFNLAVRGTIAGQNVAERAALKRVGYNYNVAAGANGYVGVNYFNFVASEGADGQKAVVMNFADGSKSGTADMRLTDKMARAMGYSPANCTIENGEEILKKLQMGSW